MGWSSKDGICSKCGKTGRLFPSFGKHICVDCKTNRPKKGTGNSGMFQNNQGMFVFEADLCLVRCKKSDPFFGRLFFEHYPGSKGIPGRSLCYLVMYCGDVAGIIGFNSPPKNYGLFNKYFGKDLENHFLINNVFRLVNNERNLATRVLSLARKTAKTDYEAKYADALIGLVTFVEPPRNGALYKADNWDMIGESEGKRMKRDRETWEKVFSQGEKKLCFGYKYRPCRFIPAPKAST